MHILQQMGIQRWRLKQPAKPASSPQASATLAEGVAPAFAKMPGEPAAAAKQHIAEAHHPQLENYSGQVVASAAEAADSGVAMPALTDHGQNSSLESYSWQQLETLLSDGALCESCQGEKCILGYGDLHADWMFVIDAPSARDLQDGQLLTGRVGQLFDAMLAAVGLDRDHTYLCSARKCVAAAGGSSHNPVTPSTSGMPPCAKLIHRQISLIQPKVVLALGEFAAQSILRANEDLRSLRTAGRESTAAEPPVVVSFNLHDVLDDPALKAPVWQDLKKCQAYL